MKRPGSTSDRARSGLVGPAPAEAADLEVEHHLAELVDRLVEEGMEVEAARAEAERRFGDPGAWRARLERVQRRRWRMRRWTQAGDVARESVAQATRTVVRSPGFAAGVVLTLALGVGANAAMFGILDRLFFQPPTHVVDHDRVVRVIVERPVMGEVRRGATVTFPDYRDLEAHEGFSAVAAWSGPREMTWGRGAGAERVRVTQATASLFPLLGVSPALGRFYDASEDRVGEPALAVISHELWRRAMAEAPDALGTSIEIAGVPYTVVGVAPPGFTGVNLSPVDVWLPLATSQALQEPPDAWAGSRGYGYYWLSVVARLAPTATVEGAEAEATALHLFGRRERIEAGSYPPEAEVALDPLILARSPEATADARVARWLGGVSLVVLLIACANVANLLLARGTRRRREVAVRQALGVARARLVLQAVLESVVLALVAGGAALLLGGFGGMLIRRLLLPGVHFADTVIGGRMALFTLALAALAGAVAGIGPALQGARADLAADLAMGAGAASARRSRLRAGLTVAQTALSVVLLAGAGLFVKSMAEVRRLDLGLDADRLLLATLELERPGLVPGLRTDGLPPVSDRDHRRRLYEDAVARITALPGVASAAATSSPFQWAFATDLRVPGLDSIPRLSGGGPYFQDVTAGYLETVGLDLLAGRALLPSDDEGGPRVTVVNETMARALWPGEDPLGKVLLVEEEEIPFTVVGVVEDASRGSLLEDPYMSYFLPLAQRPERPVNALYVRAQGDPAALAGAVAPFLRSLDPTVRYASVQPLTALLDPQARSWKLGATLFSVFGLLALLVAAVGLYGVLAFDVAQRSRELGIRTALGAGRRRLLEGVLGRGLGLALLGVGLGLLAALGLAPRAEGLLFRVSANDPLVLASVALVLLAVAGLASLVPGLRATRADPMLALRSD